MIINPTVDMAVTVFSMILDRSETYFKSINNYHLDKVKPAALKMFDIPKNERHRFDEGELAVSDMMKVMFELLPKFAAEWEEKMGPARRRGYAAYEKEKTDEMYGKK